MKKKRSHYNYSLPFSQGYDKYNNKNSLYIPLKYLKHRIVRSICYALVFFVFLIVILLVLTIPNILRNRTTNTLQNNKYYEEDGIKTSGKNIKRNFNKNYRQNFRYADSRNQEDDDIYYRNQDMDEDNIVFDDDKIDSTISLDKDYLVYHFNEKINISQQKQSYEFLHPENINILGMKQNDLIKYKLCCSFFYKLSGNGKAVKFFKTCGSNNILQCVIKNERLFIRFDNSNMPEDSITHRMDSNIRIKASCIFKWINVKE